MRTFNFSVRLVLPAAALAFAACIAHPAHTEPPADNSHPSDPAPSASNPSVESRESGVSSTHGESLLARGVLSAPERQPQESPPATVWTGTPTYQGLSFRRSEFERRATRLSDASQVLQHVESLMWDEVMWWTDGYTWCISMIYADPAQETRTDITYSHWQHDGGGEHQRILAALTRARNVVEITTFEDRHAGRTRGVRK